MTGSSGSTGLERELPAEAAVVEEWLAENELEFSRQGASYSFALPGERKLQTPVRIDLGEHALGIHAFVCRRPDEEFERVYRWMLERNMRLFGVAFALDPAGDVYLSARLPLAVVSVAELDRLMGEVLQTADGSFNTLLELGFETSIRKEWEWRRLRGESTRNLDAFRGWLEAGDARG
ncbi:YbjN domain-containing protein [Nocardioides rotundus]|uniref:YbjN domain-containing protein n=1 Tax=Nocardioides rotundus TaxID=1774216 RepID=UPI001CC17E51|nr:YbjN domain-containing protein [Nocardioides rotundus]UAL29139.1 YbjN domain-containing protein [Nocardioides rotundus]